MQPDRSAVRIPSIVLTGGPCGGKTLALAHLAEALEAGGWRVFAIPEMATLLYDHGVRPEEAGGALNGPFRRALMRGQLAHESLWREMAAISPARGKVILQDRGLFDELPYCDGREEHAGHLLALGLTVEETCRRYDLVVHLASTAVDAPAAYGHATNRQRRESAAEAAAADAATWEAWEAHPRRHRLGNLDEHGNVIDFQRKLDALTALARDFLSRAGRP